MLGGGVNMLKAQIYITNLKQILKNPKRGVVPPNGGYLTPKVRGENITGFQHCTNLVVHYSSALLCLQGCKPYADCTY